MATTLYSENLSYKADLSSKNLQNWFENRDFELIEFEGDHYMTFAGGISHHISKNDGYDTYYKEDIGGSVLIFEVKITHSKFECICYSPISLFGFLHIKVSFKEKTSWITKYRQHGYAYLDALKDFIKERK